MTLIYDDANLSPDAPIGGKAKALLAAQRAGLPVPPWFAVSPDAHGHDAREPIEFAARRLAAPDGALLAVRSSASDEDGAEHSFAGQLDSFLNVPPDDVFARVEQVWRSGFSDRVRAYRREQRLDGDPRVPAVIVQRMVPAHVAGVAFSADPVTGRRTVVVVSAVKGLGDALVGGDADGETWRVARDGRLLEQPQHGVLTDEQAKQVAALARQAERHFGRPQDVEWAVAAGKLWLLQSRPITSIATLPDPDGVYQLWDNSNIAESYGGVTTPMTFSFARHAYEGVYREFCRILSVPAAVIAANDAIFPRMLGLVRGRVYYNLLNWYRLLAMLPGYQSNRGFMEQMMGVREKLPDEIARQIGGSTMLSTRDKWRDRLRLTGSVWGLVRSHFSLPKQIARFYRRLDEALALDHPLEEMRLDELAAHYRGLEAKLLSRWDAPLVNDFFAMIFYGVLRRLTAKWCGDADGTLQNDLLSGGGGMISAEPARRVREMARVASKYDGFVDALCDAPPRRIESQMPPEFRATYDAYLAKFGDRCLEELKLESPTLHDDPLTLLRSVGLFARGGMHEKTGVGDALRAKAEARVETTVKGVFRRRTFRWVLKHARARVRDRENLRFERTRVFGRVRRVVVEVGKRLHALGLLDEPRDVFYLELEEVLSYVEGTATSIELRQLARIRKAEFERYRQMPPPDERFVTRGAVYQGNPFARETQAAAPADVAGETLKGIGCCPGVVRAAVRVVRDPRGATLRRGEILVAERTDPGWIMLFPSAAGLLVERGSLLSHSAIVSREMGIPSIVSIPGVMRWLADGDEVEMDGSTGVVRKVAVAAGGSGGGAAT